MKPPAETPDTLMRLFNAASNPATGVADGESPDPPPQAASVTSNSRKVIVLRSDRFEECLNGIDCLLFVE